MNEADHRHRSTLAEHPSVKGVLPAFIARLPGHVERIRTAQAERNAKALVMLVHKLRGAGKSFGFEPISRLAAEIEEGLLSGKSTLEVAELLTALTRYIEQVEGYAGGPG